MAGTRRRRARGGTASAPRGAPALRASVAQLRALAHPLRLRVLELFAEQPRTTMQVAELLGQPPTRLYHHVNALERAGLLRLREKRPNRGTVEKWFEAVAQRTVAAGRAGRVRRGEPRPLQALAFAALEQARRELTSALAEPGRDRPLAVRMVGVGSKAQLAAIRRRLLMLVSRLERDGLGGARAPGREREPESGGASPRGAAPAGAAADNCERWAVTLIFAPAWPRAMGSAMRPRARLRSRGARTPARSSRSRRSVREDR